MLDATTHTTIPNSPSAAGSAEHPGFGDADLGHALAYGALIGIPIMWAVGFLMMLPFGAPVAFGASVFVAGFIGPFLGALIMMLRRLLQIERAH